MVQAGDLTACSGQFCYYLSVVNIIFSVIIVPENLIVLAALHQISRKKSLKVPYILMASLATTDFLSGLVSQSLYGYFLWIQGNGFRDKDVEGANIWLLLVLNYSSYTLCGASLLIVALMSIDRLVAFALPLRYGRKSLKTIFCMALAIITIFCLTIPILRFASKGTVSAFTAAIMITIIAALIVTTVSYIVILFKFKHLHVDDDSDTNASTQAALKRLTKSFVLIGVILILMYLPQLILKPLVLSRNSKIKSLDISVEDVANTILYCNHFVNPLIFAFRHQDVRRAITATFGCCRNEPKSRRNTGSLSAFSDKIRSCTVHETQAL